MALHCASHHGRAAERWVPPRRRRHGSVQVHPVSADAPGALARPSRCPANRAVQQRSALPLERGAVAERPHPLPSHGVTTV